MIKKNHLLNNLLISKRLKKIIIGTILGDATVQSSFDDTALIKIDHGASQRDLIMWKYEELKDFITMPLYNRIYKDRPLEKASLSFKTLRTKQFKFYYDNFYQEINGKVRKVLPKWIKKYLTDPLVLAVWYMDDGSKHATHRNPYLKAVKLCTQGFTINEVTFICNVLNEKGWNCRIHYDKGPIIYIPNRNYEFSLFIKDYILPSMLYKLPLPGIKPMFLSLPKTKKINNILVIKNDNEVTES